MIAEAPDRLKPALQTRAPSETTSTMLWEFQVFYGEVISDQCGEVMSGGGLRSILVRAESAQEAAWHVERAGLAVTSVGTGVPLVDWSKPYFSREEAKCFVMLEDSEFSRQVRAGNIQKSAGRAVYSRANLERYLQSNR